MAEYLIQSETLTDIANAIREKTGGTAPIPTSDMAAIIAAFEAGGGDVTYTTGTITLAEETSEIIVQHDLGRVPRVIFIVYIGDKQSNKSSGLFAVKELAYFKTRTYGTNNTFDGYYTHTYNPTLQSLGERWESVFASRDELRFSQYIAGTSTFLWGVGAYAWFAM